MFTFMKRKNIISTRDGIDAFTAKVEPILIKRWLDISLAKKLGIAPEQFFSGHVSVQNHSLSYDEAFACLRRVVTMFNVSTYVNEKFNNALDSMHSREERNAYCDMDTVLDLIDEAKTNNAKDIEAPKDVEDAINRMNGYLLAMGPIKNVLMPSLMMAVLANNAHMTASI